MTTTSSPAAAALVAKRAYSKNDITPTPELDAIFWSRVQKTGDPDECWLWAGRTTNGQKPGGYGQFESRILGVKMRAHRYAYITTNGPTDKLVRHTCDTPLCCNPAHLLAGTQSDNMRDKVERQRHPVGEAHGRGKLCTEQVKAIRTLRQLGVAAEVIAEAFGIHKMYVHRICRKERWKTI